MKCVDISTFHILSSMQCLNAEPEILKAILGGIDPTKACDFVKLCNDGEWLNLDRQYNDKYVSQPIFEQT